MPGCRIAEAIRLKHKPVALHWSDDKPGNVVQFEKGSWGCVLFLVVAAAKGKIAVLDTDAEAPVTVTFLVNADQLAGLVVLANYGRTGFKNVSFPFLRCLTDLFRGAEG